MNKKTGVVLAVIAAMLVLCCLGGFFFLRGFTTKMSDAILKDQTFATKAISESAKGWDEAVFSTFADDNFNAPAHRESTRKLFATLKEKLGGLKSLDKLTEEMKSFRADTNQEAPSLFVTFKAKAKFEKGDGVFTVTVRHGKSSEKISDIRLDPDTHGKAP